MSKNLRKVLALLLAFCLAFSMGVVAFAAEGDAEESIACPAEGCEGVLTLAEKESEEDDDIYECSICDGEFKLFTCTKCVECKNDDCIDRYIAVDDEANYCVCFKKGFVLGKNEIKPADAREALRIAVKIVDPTSDNYAEKFYAADLNDDEKVTPFEARQILRWAVKIDIYDEALEAKSVVKTAVADFLAAYSVDQKNAYLADLVDTVLEFAAKFVDADVLEVIESVIKNEIDKLGEVDWDNIEDTIVPALLAAAFEKWATTDDIYDIALMILDGADSNEVMAFALSLAISEDFIQEILDDIAANGLVAAVKNFLAGLDANGILEAIYNLLVEFDFFALFGEDYDKADTYADFYAELLAEIDYLATDSDFAANIADVDAWLVAEITWNKENDNNLAKEIFDFIVALFANELDEEEPVVDLVAEAKADIKAAVKAFLASKTTADKNAYLNSLLEKALSFAITYVDESAFSTLETIYSVLTGLIDSLSNEAWENVEAIVDALLDAAFANWAKDADVLEIAAAIADENKDSNDVMALFVDLAISESFVQGILDDIVAEEGGLVFAIEKFLAGLNANGILEAIYKLLVEYDFFALFGDDYAFADTYADFYAELVDEIKFLAQNDNSEFKDIILAVEDWMITEITWNKTNGNNLAAEIVAFIKDLLANELDDDEEPTPPVLADEDVIKAAIAAFLSDYDTAARNAYLADLLATLNEFFDDFVEDDSLELVYTILGGLAAGLSDDDWKVFDEEILPEILDAVLAWANEDDVALIADLLEEGEVNLAIRYALTVALDKDYIDSILKDIADNGLVAAVENILVDLNNNGILEAIYNVLWDNGFFTLFTGEEFDIALVDTYPEFFVELQDELDFFLRNNAEIAGHVADVEDFIQNAYNDADYDLADEILTFIIELFINAYEA